MTAYELVAKKYADREEELMESLVNMPPPDYAAFQHCIGQIQELRRMRQEFDQVFRFKDDDKDEP